MKRFGPVAVPVEVVTATFTAPAAWAGVVAEILVALFTVKLVAGVPPNVTAEAPVKPVPVIVTLVPPEALPDAGEIPAIVGTGPRPVKM